MDAYLPHAMPGDKPAGPKSGVVYFQLSRLARRDALRACGDSDDVEQCLMLASMDEFSITFFFYYRQDIGVGKHTHDLEKATFRMQAIESVPPGGVDVYITLVEGAAHGVVWYNNRLHIPVGDWSKRSRNPGADEGTEAVVMPLTLFIEEGKHATAPDRNGDGFYTPGWDVNDRVNEAWGIRDTMRSGEYLLPSYQSWMTKPRLPGSIRQARPCRPLGSPGAECEPYEGPHNWFSYELRWTRTLGDGRQLHTGSCVPETLRNAVVPPSQRQSEDDRRLLEMIGNHAFGCGPDEFAGWLRRIDHNLIENPKTGSLDARFDSSSGFGLSYIAYVRPLPLVGWWILPKLDWGGLGRQGNAVSGGLHFVPSASRWLDWYATVGYELRRGEKATMVYEGGLKFRVHLAAAPLISHFGIRVGVRVAHRGKDTRFVVEFPGGSW